MTDLCPDTGRRKSVFRQRERQSVRVFLAALSASVCLGISGTPISESGYAQQDTGDKPAVPRAQPVDPSAIKDKPAVARPVPIPIPIPIPPPTAPPVAKPVDRAAIKEGDNPEKAEQREDLITYADLLFSRNEFKLAAQQYQIFLKEHQGSPNAPAAWFRLGECYLAAKQPEDALTSFNYLVDRFKTGAFVGAAAYRLATAEFTAGDHQRALDHFATAAAEAPAAELRLQASYYRARCLELLKKNAEAIAAYREIIATKVEASDEKDSPEGNGKKDSKDKPKPGGTPPANPFAERARLSIARLLSDDEKIEAAYGEYLALTESATTPAILQESRARAGLIAAQLGKTEESNRLLDAVLNGDADDQWVGTAQVALIFNLYATGDHEKVVQIYNRGIARTPDDVRPNLLMMVANSMRQTGDFKSAAAVYAILEKSFRALPIAAEAIFRKLQCLDEIGDLTMVNEVGNFIEEQKKIDPDTPFIDLALLMKAEWHFQRSDWKNAAEAYAAVRTAKIPEKYRAAQLYKLGWAQTEAGEGADGVASLGRFISEFPDDPFIPSALAKRAATLQGLGNRADALRDYRRIAADHADSDQLEFALEQIAYIHNVQREIPEMMAAYSALLEKFPETAGAAEAWFYVGGGHYEQKEYAKALEPLRKARTLDSENFFARATEVIVLTLFRLEDVATLAVEADLALNHEPPVKVPVPVLNYLGEKLYQKDDFKGADRFFSTASTPQKPAETPAAVWDYLGRARYEIGIYGGAVIAFDHYLSIVQRPSDRCEGYLNKGHALLAKKDYEAAEAAAREALTLVHQGKQNARARLLRGDIFHGQADHESAAREYCITAQIFVNDPEITPQALAKAARAYGNAGDTTKATELEQQLKQTYPNYRLPAE